MNKCISIDTETNNSLDPVTCKIMGLCLYTPGEKQAYIPINHRNCYTKERLDWQLTENDIKEELSKILGIDECAVIMHNGKFDYEVLKCTCDICIAPTWDTMIGAKLLDENERSAGLKQQYIDKIDPDQEKYSIDKLFENVEYADVDPDVFAYYAATDALMTYKLYQWQMERFTRPDFANLMHLAKTVEMPLVKVIAEMELAGMAVDQDYATLLSKKFHNKLDKLDAEISKEFDQLKPQIDAWKLSPEANYQESLADQLKKYPHKDEKGRYKEKKSKNEQLQDPINVASPTQLSILFYDILKCPQVSKKSPRGTGEAELEAIAEKLHLNICNLLIKRREIVKLLSTYIDVIPELAKRWPDGRVRTHFNQYGAATGRLSSSDPINFQNIPSHEKTIRMLFCSPTTYDEVEEDNNAFDVDEIDEVEVGPDEYVPVTELVPGKNIYIDGEYLPIKDIKNLGKTHEVYSYVTYRLYV